MKCDRVNSADPRTNWRVLIYGLFTLIVGSTERSHAGVKAVGPIQIPARESSSVAVTLRDKEVPLFGAVCAIKRDVPSPNGIRITINLDAGTYELAGPRAQVRRAVESAKWNARRLRQTWIHTRILDVPSQWARELTTKLGSIGLVTPAVAAHIDSLQRTTRARMAGGPRLLAIDDAEAALVVGDKIRFSGSPRFPNDDRDNDHGVRISLKTMPSCARGLAITSVSLTKGPILGKLSTTVTVGLGEEGFVVLPRVSHPKRRWRSRSRWVLVLLSPREPDWRKDQAEALLRR